MRNNIEFITLENEFLKITLCNLGASIYRIQYLEDDMVVTPIDKGVFCHNDLYYGKTIGNLCGRILIDGKVQLHGGPNGLSMKVFKYQMKDNEVEFQYKGIIVSYKLEKNSLLVSYSASVDSPELFSLTNHAFFCLGENSIDKLSLKMRATHYIYYDKDLIPIEMRPISGRFILDDYRKLGDGDIDNFFLVPDRILRLKSNKYEMTITSDFEGTQIYTDHFRMNFKSTLSSKDSYRGVAIEPQDNQLDRKILEPGNVYHRNIKYTFSKS